MHDKLRPGRSFSTANRDYVLNILIFILRYMDQYFIFRYRGPVLVRLYPPFLFYKILSDIFALQQNGLYDFSHQLRNVVFCIYN